MVADVLCGINGVSPDEVVAIVDDLDALADHARAAAPAPVEGEPDWIATAEAAELLSGTPRQVRRTSELCRCLRDTTDGRTDGIMGRAIWAEVGRVAGPRDRVGSLATVGGCRVMGGLPGA